MKPSLAKFFSWAELRGNSTTDRWGANFSSVLIQNISKNLNTSYGNWGISFSAKFGKGGGVVSNQMRLVASADNQLAAITFDPSKKQKTGVTCLGVRLSRTNTSAAGAHLLMAGLLINSSGVRYKSIARTTNLNEIYVEVEINWNTKTLRTFINETLDSTVTFETLESIRFGSTMTKSWVKEDGSDSGSYLPLWALEKTNYQISFGDIYLTHYDTTEDVSPGGLLYGSIQCRTMSPNIVEMNGSLKGMSTIEEFYANSFLLWSTPQVNKGILTANDNEDTTFSFSVNKTAAAGNLIGVTVNTPGSRSDTTQPVMINTSLYSGEKLIGSGKTLATELGADSNPFGYSPNTVSLSVLAEDIDNPDDLNIRVRMKKPD